jgi:hypothetical protein
LRYERQIVVNPDLRGTVRQPPLAPSIAKAAVAAGVKPAALITREKIGSKPGPAVTPPARKSSKPLSKANKKLAKKHGRSAGVPPAKTVLTATRTPALGTSAKPAAKTASAPSGAGLKAGASTPAQQTASPKINPAAPPKPASDAAKASKKPSPAITKNNDQDHP